MKRLNKIVAQFTKTISDLESLVNSNTKLVDINEEKIAKLEISNSDLRFESDKASNIADKLKAIVE